MPSLTIRCDGCGGSATFKDLAELHKRGGFCNDTCATIHSRDSFQTEASIRTQGKDGTWNRVDGSRLAVRGVRSDLGSASFRSAMEANCARFFNFARITWTYEPKMFVFHGEEYAPVNYRPDFDVVDRGKPWWVEVKGRWTGSDRQKLRKLKKHYPEDFARLWAITRWSKGRRGREEERLLRKIAPDLRITDYKQLVAMRHILPGWEGK